MNFRSASKGIPTNNILSRLEKISIKLSFKDFININNKLYTENGINSKKVVDNFYFIGNKFKEYKMIGISIHSYKEGMQACKVLNS